jgi:hypothetical protein
VFYRKKPLAAACFKATLTFAPKKHTMHETNSNDEGGATHAEFAVKLQPMAVTVADA